MVLSCVYAPTEEASEGVKEAFYRKLEEEVGKIQKHDCIIISGDLNAKVGREDIGKESLHIVSNDNGSRLIDFSRNRLVKSTWMQRKDVNKVTWRSPDGNTENQTDRLLIDKRHASDGMEVRSCRGCG